MSCASTICPPTATSFPLVAAARPFGRDGLQEFSLCIVTQAVAAQVEMQTHFFLRTPRLPGFVYKIASSPDPETGWGLRVDLNTLDSTLRTLAASSAV